MRADWVELGLQLQQGDDHARNDGHEGAPYRHELDDATMTAQHALHELDNVDETLTPLFEQIALTRAEVDALTRDIRQQLRFAVRKKSQAQQRKVLYAYGLRRRYSENADDENVDTPTGDKVDVSATTTSTVDSAANTGADTETVVDQDADRHDDNSVAPTRVPLYYPLPLTLQSSGGGLLYTNGQEEDEAA